MDASGEILDYDLREVTSDAGHHQTGSCGHSGNRFDETGALCPGQRWERLADIDILVTDAWDFNEFLELCTQNNVDVKIAKPAD